MMSSKSLSNLFDSGGVDGSSAVEELNNNELKSEIEFVVKMR